MEQIALLMFNLCMHSAIPNPHTVNNLPLNQQHLIITEAQYRCELETSKLLNMQEIDPPQCKPLVIECM